MRFFRRYGDRWISSFLFITLLFCGFWGLGCGNQASPPATVPLVKDALQTETSTEKAPIKSEQEASAISSEETLARIQAVDLKGSPLADLMPIANLQPNAFDEPFAKGAPTDSNGLSTVSVPANKRVYVRVWDPSLQMFSNNYLEIPEGQGSETELTQVVMVMGATFEATLLGSEGKPVPDTAISMMMVHPSVGPWWPGESITDKNGRVSFGPVPAGKFTILFQTKSVGKVEASEIILMPGERRDLGSLRLQ